MKTWLRWTGMVFLVATLGVWGFTGANTKWTKTSVQVTKVDPVLEMEYVEWEKTFLPGIDFLLGGILVSGLFLGLAVYLGKKKRA